MSFKKWIDLTPMKLVIMNHTRGLCFNALMPHETVRGGERETHFPYSGTPHIHLKFLIKGFNAFCLLSPLHPLPLSVTALISSNASGLTPYYPNHLEPSTVLCHFLHPMVRWHLAHYPVIICTSASVIQPWDTELEHLLPSNSSFQDAPKKADNSDLLRSFHHL